MKALILQHIRWKRNKKVILCTQTPEYGGGEMYFDGELIRKDGLFVPEYLHCLNPEQLK